MLSVIVVVRLARGLYVPADLPFQAAQMTSSAITA